LKNRWARLSGQDDRKFERYEADFAQHTDTQAIDEFELDLDELFRREMATQTEED
jgi:hypothetical protein